MKEVAKANSGFDLLRSSSDKFPKESLKFFPGIVQNNTDTVGAITVEKHFHLKRPDLNISTELEVPGNIPLRKIRSSLHVFQ